jgi:signal transduction histidine kinase
VTFRLEGERDGLDEVTAHVAYRIVQESLTNALRHAPGADVQVLVRGGLAGLRERVLALGGTFDAGPSASGGWLVEASLRG